MPTDPRDRLLRPLPGEGLVAETRGMARLHRRGDATERPDPVPARDQKALFTLTTRRAARLADPTPNAPLLIRIVRHPYALHPTGRQRQRYIEEPAPVARVDRTAEIAAALAERVRVRFTSAGRGRPRPFAVRTAQWNLLPPAEDLS